MKTLQEELIDLGVEVDTYQDGDTFVREYTFNDAQLQAFLLSHEEKVVARMRGEDVAFLQTLYVTSPRMEPEDYSDSVTELECFQDGFDDAKSQIESKIRERIIALTLPITDEKV